MFGAHPLNPKDILQALLNYAPTDEGKLNIAKAIMDTVDGSTGAVSNVAYEAYAKKIFNNLLVPCFFLHLRY